MKFERDLFEKVCDAFPHTTARTFSRDCGKSEGYYGSITAQNQRISTSALIYLAEVLECRKNLDASMTPKRLHYIDDAQQMIADEIAGRAQSFDSDSFKVRTMILKALANTANRYDDNYWLPPVIMG